LHDQETADAKESSSGHVLHVQDIEVPLDHQALVWAQGNHQLLQHNVWLP